jgi:Domain of unknown function (DUF4440)
MDQPTVAIEDLFRRYALATASLDLDFFASAYGESFMFASPAHAQAVKRDDFLKVIPKRSAFFRSVGLVATELAGLQTTQLDDDHILVRTRWTMRYEKERQVTDETAATYVVRRVGNAWHIVFQLDHQDLSKRVQDLGLAPAAS